MKHFLQILGATALFLIFLASCEEYYRPDIEEAPRILVIESHVTNDPEQNFVRLSKTRNYYSTSPIEWISGAKVELVGLDWKIITAREESAGYYIFLGTPIPGNQYKLRVTYLKDTYESEYATMPPLPTIDSLYTRHEVEKVYRVNSYNVPELFDQPGQQIYISAPVTPDLEYYRFSYRSIIQWVYNPFTVDDPTSTLIKPPRGPNYVRPTPEDTSYHVLYGWNSFRDIDLFNLANPKEFSETESIVDHEIVSLAYNSYMYLDSTVQEPRNWILILDQYGITRDSYDFHEKLNRQFSADGSLFDPVLSQVRGNMRCLNDPSKIVLGFFDLNSYRQYRYFLNIGINENGPVILRHLNRNLDIPADAFKKDEPPVFWELNF